MQIAIKYNIGQSVYIAYPTKPSILAYKIEAIHTVQHTPGIVTVSYNLTRNLDTAYPSGGDLSYIPESDILANPPEQLTRQQIYEAVYQANWNILNSTTTPTDIDTCNRIAAIETVKTADFYYQNQHLIKDI